MSNPGSSRFGKLAFTSYDWSPWRDHEWLAVDKNCHVGCFTSICPEVLPDQIRIPWPCLLSLSDAWLAYRRGVRCTDVGLCKLPYCEQIAMLADSGLYVWDAEREDGDSFFRRLGKPSCPIRLEDMHPYFRRIASCFTLPGVSFSDADILKNATFEDRANLMGGSPKICTEGMAEASVDPALFKLVESGRAFTATITVADRCMFEDAPRVVGPTFSTWEAVRPGYVKLVSELAVVLQSNEIVVCDMLGQRSRLQSAEFQAQVGRLPLPFQAVELQRPEGGGVRVMSRVEDVLGMPKGWQLPSGYLPEYAPDLHVEDWRFEIEAERSPIASRGMRGAMYKLGQLLWKHSPERCSFKMK